MTAWKFFFCTSNIKKKPEYKKKKSSIKFSLVFHLTVKTGLKFHKLKGRGKFENWIWNIFSFVIFVCTLDNDSFLFITFFFFWYIKFEHEILFFFFLLLGCWGSYAQNYPQEIQMLFICIEHRLRIPYIFLNEVAYGYDGYSFSFHNKANYVVFSLRSLIYKNP